MALTVGSDLGSLHLRTHTWPLQSRGRWVLRRTLPRVSVLRASGIWPSMGFVQNWQRVTYILWVKAIQGPTLKLKGGETLDGDCQGHLAEGDHVKWEILLQLSLENIFHHKILKLKLVVKSL